MKAIALISGGLDSTLAAKIIKELGIELVALNTKTPFCLCDHHSSSGCVSAAANAAKQLGLKLITLNVSEEFIAIIKKPRHGYGSHMNPCIDCRILLFKKAKEYLEKEQAAFIITGEVLGQRPMSQRKAAMKLIDKKSGTEGLVLRPLCAKFMDISIPEKNGWVSRDKLLAICGRSRGAQFSLAKELGINDYPCPSGGCLLTNAEFSKRVKDLIKHNELNVHNAHLLKVGRHFRLSSVAKLIVGRNETENSRLLDLAEDRDHLFTPRDEIAGATALGIGLYNEELVNLAARITGRYCDLGGDGCTEINYKSGFNAKESTVSRFSVDPVEEGLLKSLRI